MGALEEGRFNAEIENEVELCCHGGGGGDEVVGFEEEPETIAIKEAVKTLLHGLNEDVNREGIRKTPFRVAKALRQGTRGYKQRVKEIVQGALFPEAGVDHGAGQAGGVGGFVVVRDLDHFSYCESCLLPFQVKFHVGYIPAGQRVVGLSKLSRVADVFAKRLQEPQRLADETCSALQRGFGPAGVAVVLQCEHLQFPTLDSSTLVPNSKSWVKFVVCAGSGVFEDESSTAWAEFLSLLKFRGTMVDRNPSLNRSWCPFRDGASKIEPSMAAAVSSIIGSLGEDPMRKELAGTPARFVGWLGNFRNVEMEMKLKLAKTTNGFFGGEKKRIESELNLPFWSQCEHHLLPFHGVVHIGYMCYERENGPIPDRSSVLRSIVHFYGFKLQVQERLTRQIAETVSSFLGEDVIVVVEASHTCMISRGIEKFGSNTATIAVLGRFSTDSAARAKFLQGIPVTTTY